MQQYCYEDGKISGEFFILCLKSDYCGGDGGMC